MNTLTWLGTVAGTLIAVGTVLRWTLRRTLRAARWVAAVVRLPDVVDDLAHSVADLSTAVAALSASVDATRHESPVLESL